MMGVDTNIEVFRCMRMTAIILGALCTTPVFAAGLVDPTRPPSRQVETEPAYMGPVLQSTIIAPGHKRAIISGRTYAVGERIGAAVITQIAPYEVTLNKDGRETRLRIVPSLAKEAQPADGRGKGVNP